MRLSHWVLSLTLASSLALAGYGSGFGVRADATSFSAAQKASVEREVRQFAAAVSRDVTQKGPRVWDKYLEDSPAFFMASEGKLVFPDRQAARTGIDKFSQAIQHIELKWGDDLRVDPLTPEFAIVASSWHEVWTDKEGHQTTENGFFTGLAESHNGQWQFRNANWSVAAPASTAP